jgi:histidyl-tRNA synthetase
MQGMQDYGADKMAVRQLVFDRITTVFKRHGAVTIDTPVMELRVGWFGMGVGLCHRCWILG